MASERAKQMQTANTLAEVLASLERIEIALGIKPKPEEVKVQATPKPAETGEKAAQPGQGSAAVQPRQGMVSRQNPTRGQR